MQCRVIQKIEIFLGSRISKFLRPAQRYDDFKLIRFKKPSKTELLSSLPVSLPTCLLCLLCLLAGVTISGTPCPRHIIVPFGAEAPSGHAAQA